MFEQLLLAVDRLYTNETLQEFWRHGTLVANRAHPHPFQADIPQKYQAIDRWFLLDTSLDPKRPWEMTTNLPVFSLALVLGEPGSRRWLVYAHSPLENRRGVEITLPNFGPLELDVPQAGAFCLVEEQSRSVRPVAGVSTQRSQAGISGD
jgi:hypothetical protein